MTAKFRPKYYGGKIDTGVYVQPHDDGETWLAVVKKSDGWAWGVVTQADAYEIDMTLNFRGDAEYALALLKGCANHRGYRTKAEAIESAMKREVVA